MVTIARLVKAKHKLGVFLLYFINYYSYSSYVVPHYKSPGVTPVTFCPAPTYKPYTPQMKPQKENPPGTSTNPFPDRNRQMKVQ